MHFIFYIIKYSTSRKANEPFCAYTLKVTEYTFKLALNKRNKTKSHVNKIDSVLLRNKEPYCVSASMLYKDEENNALIS